MESYKQEFIEFMVESQVLKFGDFTLKSGRKSPFFMNAGAYVTGTQLRKLGEYYAKAIHDNFGLDFATLDPEACDMPFGFGSGGGVIFGVTGGVTEAVLRRLTNDHSKEAMHEIAESGVRGEEGIKEFSVDYQGTEIKICVASGLANARKVMDQVKNGEKEYHLIEIMACRRGCIMGGGQPTRAGDRTKSLRAKGLYNADNTTIIKKSDENPLVQELYAGLLKGKEHELLHNESYE